MRVVYARSHRGTLPFRAAFLVVLVAWLLCLSATAVAVDCAHCGKPISGTYVEYDGYPYHRDCYLERVAPRCAVCGQPLVGDWIEFDGQDYHQRCYEKAAALRCSYCGGIIEGEYLIDHWGNQYHKYHEDEIPTCSFCGRFLSGSEADDKRTFDGAHRICSACRSTAVTNEKLARRKLNEIGTMLSRIGVVIETDDIEFELVSREELAELLDHGVTNEFGLTQYKETTFWGSLREREFTIYILSGLPRMHFISTAAHELMHVWCYVNAPEEEEPQLVEGSCNYAALRVLQQVDDAMAGYVIRQIEEESDPIYGDGLRRVKRLVDNRGLEYWLQHLRFDPDFPIGY